MALCKTYQRIREVVREMGGDKGMSNDSIELIVKDVLTSMPETRGDDKELILQIWKSQGLVLTIEQISKIKRCSSPETIRRIRQKIQHDGLLRPPEKVWKARKEKEMHDKFAKPRKTFQFDPIREVFIEII